MNLSPSWCQDITSLNYNTLGGNGTSSSKVDAKLQQYVSLHQYLSPLIGTTVVLSTENRRALLGNHALHEIQPLSQVQSVELQSVNIENAAAHAGAHHLVLKCHQIASQSASANAGLPNSVIAPVISRNLAGYTDWTLSSSVLIPIQQGKLCELLLELEDEAGNQIDLGASKYVIVLRVVHPIVQVQ